LQGQKNGAPDGHAMILILSRQSLFAKQVLDGLSEHGRGGEAVSIGAASVRGDFPVVNFGVVGRLAHIQKSLSKFDAEVHVVKVGLWIREFQSINKAIWTKNSDEYSLILDFPVESATY